MELSFDELQRNVAAQKWLDFARDNSLFSDAFKAALVSLPVDQLFHGAVLVRPEDGAAHPD